MLNQVFIMISFILGIIVGCLITYIIMGSFFSKAVGNIKATIKKSSGDDVSKHEHFEALKSFDFNKNKALLSILGVVLILVIISLFVIFTGKKPTTEGESMVSESIESAKDIDSLNSGLKKGAGGR